MKKLIVLFLMVSSLLFPDIVGRGIGETEVLAKKSALDELSQQIEVTVDSIFSTKEESIDGVYSRDSAGVVNLLSNNFLIGVDYKTDKIGKNFAVTATIGSDKVYFYEQKIYESYELVGYYYNKAKLCKSFGEKKSYLLASVKELKKGDSYKNISFLLGSKKVINPPINIAELKDELQKLKNANLDKMVVYIDISDEKYGNIKNLVTKNINAISKESNLDILIGDKDFNNTSLVVNVASLEQEVLPPFYYNGKKLSDTIYKSSITLSFVLKDSLGGTIYDSFTFSNSGKSFLSAEDAINISVNRLLRDAKEKLSLTLQSAF